MEVFVLICDLGLQGVYSSYNLALKAYEESGMSNISSNNYIHGCQIDGVSWTSLFPLN